MKSWLETIQFSAITQFSSIWTIDRTLSGITTSNQSGPGSSGNEGVLRITEDASSDCLVSYPGDSLEESYPLAETQSVYSTAPTKPTGQDSYVVFNKFIDIKITIIFI